MGKDICIIVFSCSLSSTALVNVDLIAVLSTWSCGVLCVIFEKISESILHCFSGAEKDSSSIFVDSLVEESVGVDFFLTSRDFCSGIRRLTRGIGTGILNL